MNTTSLPPVPPAPRSRFRILKWIAWSFLGCFVISVLSVASMFFLDGDAAALRDEMKEARGDCPLNTKVQMSLGPISLAAVRTVLGQINGVDEEARLALSAVRSVSVGVYSMSANRSEEGRGEFDCTRLDRRMKDRGWTRMVAVREHGKVVLVYSPSESSFRRTLPLCIGVIDGDQVIVVSVRGDPESILKIAQLHQPGLHL